MRTRLLAGLLVFAILVTAALEIPLGLSTRARLRASAISALRRDGISLSVVLSDALAHYETGRATEIASRYSRATRREVLVTRAGKVVAASSSAAQTELSESTLATVLITARSRTVSGETSERDSESSLFYVALPLQGEGHVKYAGGQAPVLLVTFPATVVNGAIRRAWLKLGLIGLASLVVATALGLLISSSLIRPLRRIEEAVEAIGGGSLEVRAPTDTGPGELRRLAGSINQTAERLIRLVEAQQSFVADASHQLRTPLTALRLRLENLKEADSSSVAHDLAAALDEVSRLSRLVEALLALARGEADQPTLVKVDVGAVVNERLEVWRPLAEEQQLGLGASLRPHMGPLVALACPDVLEQVLDNLLANAFEATPNGGQVQMEAYRSDQFVEIHVIDTGSGIDPAGRERAFDRFWRGPASGPDGTGLGLAIVDQLVRISGGSSELREARGGGTDATVRLLAA